jgi:putative membrane protein
MMGFGMIGGMFLFWIALIILVVLASRGLFQANKNPDSHHAPISAKEILQHRYARGEITRDQYEKMAKDLQ